jgi:type IV secretion system protein VirB10
MKNNSPDYQLDLNSKPRITKVNRSAFLLICGIILVIIIVLAYSIGQARKVGALKNDTLTQVSNDEVDDKQLWYNKVSDELPVSTTTEDKPKSFESDDSLIDRETLKKRNESLHAALESSIKVSNIGNTTSGTSSSVFTSENNLSTPINAFSDNSYEGQVDLNMQGEKKAFLNTFLQKTNPDYLHETVKKPLSPYEVKAGTVIPAVLALGINSDLPGQSTALVSQNVYDSVTGRYLLIPQGSKLILQYDSRVSYGQKRLLVAVKRLIFPNGNSLDLEGTPASDSGGYSGLYDEVDNHYVRIFGSSAMMGLITGGFELSQPSQGSDTAATSASQIMAGALGQQMGQVTLGIMNKNLDIQPTIKIHPGYEFNVTVTSDLVFPGHYRN